MSRALLELSEGVLRCGAFPGVTGAGVRVAVVDSGVEAGIAASAGVGPGVAFDAAGVAGGAIDDRHGHGSAVVATIRAVAPQVVILPVKVFDLELRATADALVAAIDWAAAAGADLINLSLGTTTLAHRLRLGEALVRAARAGATVVAAAVDEAGTEWLPGSLPLAVGVTVDRALPRQAAVVTASQEGAVRRLRMAAADVSAAGPASGPAAAGVSFAVANASGLLALYLASRRRR